MSDTDHLSADDQLAAELALGVLDGDARRAALMRLADDAAFAERVDAWSALLAGMVTDTPAVAPPAGARDKIMAAIFGLRAPQKSTPERRTRRARALSPLAFWKGASAVFAAIAIAALGLAGILLKDARPERARFSLVATLVPPEAPAILSVRIDPQTGAIEIVDAALQQALATSDQVTELWLIPADGTPRSLGLINAIGATRVEAVSALRAGLRAGALLAVSVEPAGGSPTGAPTGPVIAIGALRASERP